MVDTKGQEQIEGKGTGHVNRVEANRLHRAGREKRHGYGNGNLHRAIREVNTEQREQ